MSRIESNYRLLRLSLPACRDRDAELVFIRDVTRRNSSLVTRAARFVAGEEDAYCARGIEMMAGHSSLPQLVCEMANVEAGEAMAMIRRALNLPCLTSLNGIHEDGRGRPVPRRVLRPTRPHAGTPERGLLAAN
ncbi:hypothetical protein MRX96_001712 [Rhipicephalus microplus]